MGASNSVPIVDLPNNVTEDSAAPFITEAADVAADLAAVANASLGLSAKTEPPVVSRQLSGAEKQDVLGVRINDYKMDDKVLGVGGFGKVRLATSRTTGHQVAIKIIKREKLQARSETLLAREVKHHERLRHENIVRLYTWIRTPGKYYLVMEVCPHGDLLGYLNKVGALPVPTARAFFKQLLSGVAFCHSLGVHHRDLKLENVLLAELPASTAATAATATAATAATAAASTAATPQASANPVPGGSEGGNADPPAPFLLKISDFGLSDLRPFTPSATYCGSPLYAAPELMDSASRAANPEGCE
jgi:5'-AMP-activated protein kinase catalytic alpha subunit